MNLFLASGNAHKVRELRAIAAECGAPLGAQGPLTIESARALGGMPHVVEDTGTFLGNARKKARALLPLLPPGGWALADDSGLCVDALDGAPGVESAYFAGPEADDWENLRKLMAVMVPVPIAKRDAHYVCVLVLLASDGREYHARGECHGHLAREPAGEAGFGYDPLFVPSGFDRRFAQLPAAVKRKHSHRRAAWHALVAQLAS